MNRFCMQDFTVHDYTQDLFDNCQVKQVKMHLLRKHLLRICLRAHQFGFLLGWMGLEFYSVSRLIRYGLFFLFIDQSLNSN